MFHKEGKVHFLISERRGLDANGNKRPSIIEYEMSVQNDVLSVLHFLGHYTDKEDATEKEKVNQISVMITDKAYGSGLQLYRHSHVRSLGAER